MPQIIVSLVISALMVLGGVAYTNETKTPSVGASQTISSLTELTSLSHNDVFPITEVNGLTTKKVKWGTATSSLKVINDALYSPIIGSASITTLGTITTGTWNADTLTVSKGGTGSTSLIAYQLLAGNGTGAVTTFGNGTSGYVLTSNGAGALPSFQNVGVTTGNNNTWTGTNTFTATTTISGPISVTKSLAFGGDGSDGALSVTSGTTTIDLGNNAVVIKNYSSILVSSGAGIAFTNATSTGTIVIFRSNGSSTVNGIIDVRNVGGIGATGVVGVGGQQAIYAIGSLGRTVYQGTTTGPVNNGRFALTPLSFPYNLYNIGTGNVVLFPGQGGAQGQSGNTCGGCGTGGRGAGAFSLQVNGSLDFKGIVDIRGSNGSDGGSPAGGNSGNGGMGGGGGGTAYVIANSFTSNTGLILASGGNGGIGSAAAGGGNAGYYGGAGGVGAGSLGGDGGASVTAGNNGATGSNGGASFDGFLGGNGGTGGAQSGSGGGSGGGGGGAGYGTSTLNKYFF